MFSSKSFIVFGFTFRSLIYFECIFVYGVRKCSNFLLLHVAAQFSQHQLLKRLSLPHCILLPPLSKIRYPYVCRFISGFSIMQVLLLQCTDSLILECGLVAPRHVQDLSSRSRDQTHIICTAREILNHWTTMEVPVAYFLFANNRGKSFCFLCVSLSICHNLFQTELVMNANSNFT